ncbi:TetR/AcrR family transcriptional regulator [Amycolatopsis sp.]|uniref:TetR/AcrR family transcriptional regulator n=1 Tax=Amycolatopsis sp. TaxID=37632 RepID=UPI002C0754ED|nr:TetR/AcrR family transcriptional regulator [Amycolatopsis sp.]HVV10475.1 TetR/AcrR family transcriptional regulator [Amycolatopsis sp.]
METPATDHAGLGRREEIFAAAAEIFWAKGYHATSMNDVANAMSMRKASVYHHIKNKETLLYEMSVSSMRHMIDAAMSATSPDPEERLNEAIVRHVEALLDDRSRHATALVELRSLSPAERQHIVEMRDSYDHLIDGMVAAVQESTGRWPGIPARLVRLAMLGMLNWVVFWFSPDGKETAESIARTFSAILMPRTDKTT